MSEIYNQPEPLRNDQQQLLQHSAELFRLVVEHVKDYSIFTMNHDGRVASWNIGAERLFGYTEAEIMGQPFATIFTPEDIESGAPEQEMSVAVAKGVAEDECWHVRYDGTRFWASGVLMLLRDDAGDSCGFVKVARDETERKLAEQALRHESTLMQALMDHIPDAIYFKDADGRFTRVSRHTHLRGITSPEEAIGKTDFDFFTEEHALQTYEDEQQIISTGQPIINKVEKKIFLDGTEGWVSTTKVPIFDAVGRATGIIGVSRDITERKMEEEALQQVREDLERRVEERTAELARTNAELRVEVAGRRWIEEKLLHEAFHDTLTGLPNRAMFIDHLRRAIGRTQRHDDYLFAVLFLDLDRFKIINDSVGHQVGDQLLVATARKLEAALRPEDIVARLSGDEFTILLDNIHDVSDAIRVVERIHKDLQTAFHLDGNEVFTTASIGIALSSTKYMQPEEMLRDADTAMYRAKVRGRDGCAHYEIFDQSMQAEAVTASKLETDLRRAVERQEFVVYYQPIVSIATKRINAFEALVRWQHPERGLIPPAEFIPVAEETGLIVPLGQWVLGQACRQVRQWQEWFPTNPPCAISVNLSSKQFAQPDLVGQVEKILCETKLDPHSLRLELTESMVMKEGEAAARMLRDLRTLGVELVIDDFGTGYSSLSYLPCFPISTLKVDRSFVSKMANKEDNNWEIIRTIRLLAGNLRMEVIAEGVETAEQLDQLTALGCEYGQGYYFSKPVNSRAATTLLSMAATA